MILKNEDGQHKPTFFLKVTELTLWKQKVNFKLERKSFPLFREYQN